MKVDLEKIGEWVLVFVIVISLFFTFMPPETWQNCVNFVRWAIEMIEKV